MIRVQGVNRHNILGGKKQILLSEAMTYFTHGVGFLIAYLITIVKFFQGQKKKEKKKEISLQSRKNHMPTWIRKQLKTKFMFYQGGFTFLNKLFQRYFELPKSDNLESAFGKYYVYKGNAQ